MRLPRDITGRELAEANSMTRDDLLRLLFEI